MYTLTGVIAQQAKRGRPSHHAVGADLTNGDAEFHEQALALSPLQPALSPLKPESPRKHPIITSIDMQGALSQSASILTSRWHHVVLRHGGGSFDRRQRAVLMPGVLGLS